VFANRTEAGKQLANQLLKLQLPNPTVLALPRGGVPVAAEIAKALAAPLDVLVVRKVGAPHNLEIAVAALVDGDPPDVVLNREMIEAHELADEDLAALIARERPELERRKRLYGRSQLRIAGKTVILVDDGAATGTTMKAAFKAISRRSPREIIIALPVASADALDSLSSLTSRVVCLARPVRFRALSFHYREFEQVSDAELRRILNENDDLLRRARLQIFEMIKDPG